MAVKALYDYDFPSADRAELFGDDQLVYVHWEGNPLFCSAACFRVPKALGFGEFVETVVGPWAASDPDFDPTAVRDWRVNGRPLDGSAEAPLTELGIGHKALLQFTA
ncbi:MULTISPECIES: phenol hydroxylase subunit P4 [unclassified Amycolatopsis]|uniref:Phenol hydroxylase subunit P4 n=1 Tax=Amycolatopsis carbonis TaxID=715471 RepID=A0A9Y2MYI0_9PSEU|nr:MULTISPECIES: phenol hydroxylase subunit P4 [unclassified Amycolatopsis]QYN23238.1 phenol hydroxylase subunit P4 [Amycolatopsis sp. DSM 110486]WIX81668.1 phenol hydroxylase subunit P4 [Amycolatopsis sp. 2-15]